MALRLAARGRYTAHPNPRVGCVLVKDNQIVGRGWHERPGGPHAEINALNDAGAAAQGATAYVTLEPCSHSGKTPPCTDALVAAGVEQVICAMEDPYHRVSGSGISALKLAQVDVRCGLMQAQAEQLNRGFLIPCAQRSAVRSFEDGFESRWCYCDVKRREPVDNRKTGARRRAAITG